MFITALPTIFFEATNTVGVTCYGNVPLPILTILGSCICSWPSLRLEYMLRSIPSAGYSRQDSPLEGAIGR